MELDTLRPLALWLSAPIFLTSCSTLPYYAQPSAEIIRQADYRATDVTSYRTISRGDFRATSPPERIASHAAEPAAYTCASIVPESFEAQIEISLDQADGRYTARVVEMGYRSEMDRECSWWNTDSIGQPAEYILEHEQIHFAIFELQARRLEGIVAEIRGRGASRKAASTAFQRALESAIRAAMQQVLERSSRFDEQTSLFFDPDRQSEWSEQVDRELRESR